MYDYNIYNGNIFLNDMDLSKNLFEEQECRVYDPGLD